MTATIYDAIGGHDAVVGLVDGLYDRLVHDHRVMHHFAPERLPSLKQAQVRWFTACLSGDELPADLTEAHAHLRITDEQVGAVVEHLQATMVSLGVDRHLRRAVGSVVSRLWYARQF